MTVLPPIQDGVLAMIALIQLRQLQPQDFFTNTSVNRVQKDGEDVSEMLTFFILSFDDTNEICFLFYFSFRRAQLCAMKTGGKKVSFIIFTKVRQRKIQFRN